MIINVYDNNGNLIGYKEGNTSYSLDYEFPEDTEFDDSEKPSEENITTTLRNKLKSQIQAKTESLINELAFAHPNDSDVVFSASMSAGSLWDKLDAKKTIDGFFPLAKTQYNDEIHMIEDLEEFDNLTSLLFATQKIVWDENAQLKQSLNNMSLEDLQNFKDTR